MIAHFTGASAVLMMEVGRQAGLFEAMAEMPPATSFAIAERAGPTERYVREWLGAMVCSRIVEYDPSARTYVLPPEHRPLVTSEGGSRNLATLAAMFPLLSRVVPEVLEAFRGGGGVPYARFQPDFTGLMDGRSRPRYRQLLFAKYLGSVEGLTGRLEAGIRVADIGCGTGFCVNLMAERFPRSQFVGYDFSDLGLEEARAEARAMGVGNVSFVAQDVARLPAEPQFDLITAFDAIHDQARPPRSYVGSKRPRARRDVPHARRLRLEQPRGQRRCADVRLRLHDQHAALHDRVAGSWRDRPRDGLGGTSWPSECCARPVSRTSGSSSASTR
jgi:SAM-dependent methyltransferase